MHLDYNLSSGPFLSFDLVLGLDQDLDPDPDPSLTNVIGIIPNIKLQASTGTALASNMKLLH